MSNNQPSIISSLAQVYHKIRATIFSIGISETFDRESNELEKKNSGYFSIVVAVHNSPAVTQRCINSIEMFGYNAEVIFIDDGSTEKITSEILEASCTKNGWSLITNKIPQGHSRASEAGAKIASREFICLFNSDAMLSPRCWSGIIKAFENERVAVAGPMTSATPGPQQIYRANRCRHYWSDAQIWNFAKLHTEKHANTDAVHVDFAGGFAFFIRKTVWIELDGFDPNLPDYGNETEFCKRVKSAGYDIVYTKNSYIHHFGKQTYGKKLNLERVRELSLQADSYIEEKHK